MRDSLKKLGVMPFLLLGSGLLFIGLSSINHIVDNWWPFDVGRLDLVRDTALHRADPATLLAAANLDIVLAFLAAVLVTTTGIVMPLIFVLNKRFGNPRGNTSTAVFSPAFWEVLRQSMWVGLWVSFCTWLQMNRMLGIAIAALAALVLGMFEMLIQLRTKAAIITH